MTKVQVKNNGGYMLVLPKETNAPLLFLEWVSSFRGGYQIIHKVIDNQDGVIKVRLNCLGEQYHECRDYINANL